MGRWPRFTRTFAWAALLASLAVAARPASAQILINEIYPDPAVTNTGTERIEVYNAGSTPIDVTGWCIHDAATIDGNPAPARCRLPEDFDTSNGCSGSAIIQPGEYRVVKGTSTAAFLNNTGDDVYLCSNRTIPATVVHLVTYPSAAGHTDEVWAALPNGSGNFAWRTKSLCGSNGATGDVTAPGTVTDLLAIPGTFPGEVRLTWTAPGDDGVTGTATAYQIKVSLAAINGGNFAAAGEVNFYVDEPLPKAGGSAESLYVYGLTPSTTYHFALVTQDEVPNTSGVSNDASATAFAGAPLNPDLGYQTYFGNLHSHTGYSDGEQTPAAAYNFARNTAPTPLDFLEVSEHNHSNAGMSLPSYALGLSQANAANDDGNFVAIYGQEWGVTTNPGDGHVNIIQAPVLFGWESGNYDVFVPQSNYPALYTAALANPPPSYPPIAELCHPAPGDFNNLAVTPDALAIVHLMALVNGPAFSTATDESDIGNTNFDPQFNEALRKGFRVSPTADQDNHHSTWGASSESRTAVLAPARTKADILAALAARRAYATQDHNAIVKFSAEGHPMGAAFTTSSGIRIAASVTDADVGDAVAQIDLFRGFTNLSSAVRIAGNVGNSTFNWRERQTFTPGAEAHYYLHIRMADSKSIWSGPVYVTYQPGSSVAVDEPPSPAGRLSLAARPNPSFGSLTADFSLPAAAGRARLALYDLAGRRVRTLIDGPLDAGAHHVPWDGRADDGSRPSAGIFFLRLETGAGWVEQKVLLLH